LFVTQYTAVRRFRSSNFLYSKKQEATSYRSN